MPRPPRPWFRFYSEAIDSEKLADLPDRLVKPWLLCLCMANVNKPRGYLPNLRRVRHILRVKEDKAQGIIEELVAHGFIDQIGAEYVMHDWAEWQPDRDVTPGKRDVNHANVTETSRSRHDRVRERVEEEKDREVEEEEDIEGEEIAPAPLIEPADGRFFREYVRHYQEAHAMVPPSPVEQGAARALETDFGSELCIRAAEETGWTKHPNWLRKKLEDPDNGRTPVGASNGTSTPSKSPFAAYGT